MDTKLFELAVINAPNLVGLIVLSSVLYAILNRTLGEQTQRIDFLESLVTRLLNEADDEHTDLD